jgi:hypothetical protein
MDIAQLEALEKCYSVLEDTSKFRLQADSGLSFSSEIIEYEFEAALDDIGMSPKQCSIPITYKNLCCLHDGFSVRWQCLEMIEKGYPSMGYVKFSRVADFVLQNIMYEGKRLFLFDDFLDRWKVFMELTQDPKAHRLYYANLYEKKISPMTISTDQYIQKAALSRGLTNWHEFFLENERYESDEGNRVRFKKELETLFSDVRFDDFIRKTT